MRKLVLMAIFCSGVFYAPLPLIAQRGGGQTPLIPVADMPSDSGSATAPSDPPLEVDSEEVPELVPPQHVGGGAEAPSRAPAPAPAAAPAPEPVATPAPAEPLAAEPAQTPDEPVGEVPVPDEEPTDGPTTPAPDEDEQDEQDEEEFEEEFEEDFGEGPEAGEPDAPAVAPGATAGPQLPRTGAELPALLLSGLALTASGMSLRALCRSRS